MSCKSSSKNVFLKEKIKMTKNIDSRRLKLIKQIMEIADEEVLLKIENQIDALQSSQSLRNQILKPTRDNITLEELKKEQNYQPIKREEFFALAESIGIEESIEDLLAELD